MFLKRKYFSLKKSAIILLVLLAGFSAYVIAVNKNSKNMTAKQKILKAIYPAMMWFTKVTGTNTRLLTNNAVEPTVSIYNLTATLTDGSIFNLNDLKGKKILVVNTASDCGYTGQYDDLEKLHQLYKDKLVILGFPANDFKDQEKAADAEIAAFCKLNYGVTFPLMKKSKVIAGAGQNEVYQWLTNKDKNGWNEQAPSWNFCKYLVDEQGFLIAFYASSVPPLSHEIVNAIAK